MPRGDAAPRQGGFTYLVLLIAIAVLSVGLLAVSEVWSNTAQRQKMVQADWAGRQYAEAIASYYYSARNASERALPRRLDDLLEDKRFTPPRRHLRELYPNPFTRHVDWPLVMRNGGIYGVGQLKEMPQGYPQGGYFAVISDHNY